MSGILEWVRHRLLASVNPTFRRYLEAKRLHEKNPHGTFHDGFYLFLTDEQKRLAYEDPQLNRVVELYIELAKEEGARRHPLNEGVALHQAGLVRLRQGRTEEARQAYSRALEILRHLPDRSALESCSSCHFHLAEIAIERHQFDLAREHACRSREIDVGLRDSLGVSMNDVLLREIESRDARGR